MPILALHGFTGCGADFAPFADLCGDALAGNWHCPDLPGHGVNSELDCSPGAVVRFINDTIAESFAATDPSPRQLIGYSMGARAALLHAVDAPASWDALILISGNPGIENPGDRSARITADKALADSLQRMGAPAFLDFWQETPLIRSQKTIPSNWRKAMLKNRENHTADGMAKSLHNFGQGSCPDLWPQLGKLTMPVCLISGARDRKYTDIAKRMIARLANPLSQHTAIESASHMPHLEQAEATADVIRRFIKTLPAR